MQNSKKLDLLKISATPTLIISQELSNIINYYHSKVGKKEWSGILFYSVLEGSIADLDKLVLKAETVLIKDIGTSASTSYEEDETVFDFFDSFPETENMRRGIIHTHHSMNAYFSGTDNDELRDNAKHYDYYLSLIVNFDGDYCARVAMQAETEPIKVVINDGFGGKLHTEISQDEQYILYADCDVQYDIKQPYTDFYEKCVEANKKQAQTKRVYYNQSNFYEELYPHLYPAKTVGKKKQIGFQPQQYENAVRFWLGDYQFHLTVKETLEALSGEVDEDDVEIMIEGLEEHLDTTLQFVFGSQTQEVAAIFLEEALKIIEEAKVDTPVTKALIEYINMNLELANEDEYIS